MCAATASWRGEIISMPELDAVGEQLRVGAVDDAEELLDTFLLQHPRDDRPAGGLGHRGSSQAAAMRAAGLPRRSQFRNARGGPRPTTAHAALSLTQHGTCHPRCAQGVTPSVRRFRGSFARSLRLFFVKSPRNRHRARHTVGDGRAGSATKPWEGFAVAGIRFGAGPSNGNGAAAPPLIRRLAAPHRTGWREVGSTVG